MEKMVLHLLFVYLFVLLGHKVILSTGMYEMGFLQISIIQRSIKNCVFFFFLSQFVSQKKKTMFACE